MPISLLIFPAVSASLGLSKVQSSSLCFGFKNIFIFHTTKYGFPSILQLFYPSTQKMYLTQNYNWIIKNVQWVNALQIKVFDDSIIIKFDKMADIIPVLFYFYPIESFWAVKQDLQGCANNIQESVSENSTSQKQSFTGDEDATFWSMFKEELRIANERFEKKVWTEEEDELLLELREHELGWRDISKRIQGTNEQVCKRRYIRISRQIRKWPKEIDRRIKYLYEVQKKTWEQISQILKGQFGVANRKKPKQIKKRYQFKLSSHISKQSWTVEQDLNLLQKVKELGKKWKRLSNIFTNRTQLQLKNRYYGTLLPVRKRVLKKILRQLKDI